MKDKNMSDLEKKKVKSVGRPKGRVLTEQIRFWITKEERKILEKAVNIDRRRNKSEFCRLYILRVASSLVLQNQVNNPAEYMKSLVEALADTEELNRAEKRKFKKELFKNEK